MPFVGILLLVFGAAVATAAPPACKIPSGQGIRVNCGYAGISECARTHAHGGLNDTGAPPAA